MSNRSLIFPLSMLCIVPMLLQAQKVVDVQHVPIKQAVVQNMTHPNTGLDVDIKFLEAPAPDGDSYWGALAAQKVKSAELYPKQQKSNIQTRGQVDMPTLLNNFVGNNTNNGAPCDNHLSISNDGQIVSVVNRHFAVKNTQGNWLSAATLENFANPLGISATKYDPKTLYDPINDRFVIFMLAGFASTTSKIIVAVSATNDAAGDWFLYTLPGNPFDLTTWSDYPMITMTKEDIYLTINLIYDDEPWETGFKETLIWKMSLADLYSGDAWDAELISGIGYGGAPLRNVCPVQFATEDRGETPYFFSNRNFDLENDTIFFLQLEENPNTMELEAVVTPLISDIPYGMPPNVEQEVGYLSTNDARVLDAVKIGNEIQFVSNTIDFETGTAAVFHGVVEDVNNPSVTAHYLLTPDSRELGYASLAFVGDDVAENRDVIILAAHGGIDINVGYSACYMDDNGDYSDWLLVKDGDGYVDMLNVDDGFERWGDYSATQRVYNDPGKVWVSSTFGESDKDADTWLSCLVKPGYVNAIQEVEANQTTLEVFPNPAQDRVSLLVDIPQDCKQLQIQLLDLNGQVIQLAYQDKPKRTGSAEISIDILALPTGLYYLQVFADDQQLGQSKVIIE